MEKKKPNIFEIATSELSQDAFITWLLRWGDPACKQLNLELHNAAVKFAKSLISLDHKNLKSNFEVSSISANRQKDNIDVWSVVNKKYLIIIENKTFTSAHSNQLKRYLEKVKNWKEVKELKCKVVAVYLKTGNESQRSLNFVKNDGFNVYSRTEFLKVLNSNEVNNDIYNDFKDRLNRLEEKNNEWKDKIINDWNGNDWQGFYQYLESEINIKNWHFVNNASGGFWNAILTWDKWDIYPFYLQIEAGNLCFKISTDPREPVVMPKGETRSGIRNKAYKLLKSEAAKQNIKNIIRPKRFGNGKYMTVSLVKQADWMGNLDDVINLEQVVENLKRYKVFLKSITDAH